MSLPVQLVPRCGKKSCTAGKLWKRSEEFRKVDAHDSAGADLLRALKKKGLETEFKEKCALGLRRAFEGVKRQRERERREKDEEEKAEKRRLEEEKAMAEAEERRKAYEAEWEAFARGVGGESEVSAKKCALALSTQSHSLIASLLADSRCHLTVRSLPT